VLVSRHLMNTTWRSWRVLLLAWAVVLAPQLAFVHALSHVAWSSARAASTATSVDQRQQAPDKACETCLAFAPIAASVPSHHPWQPQTGVLPQPLAVLPRSVPARHTAHFLARAPPPAVI
jgi:hypothetical protein